MRGTPVRYSGGDKVDPSAPASASKDGSPCGVDGVFEIERVAIGPLPSPVKLHHRLSPWLSQPQPSRRRKKCGILRSAARLQYRTYVLFGLLFALINFVYLVSNDPGSTAKGGRLGPGWARLGFSDFEVTKHDVSNPGWNWDRSPVVIESHKLIFFTIPKVGCTVFKQLFRRMMGHENWKTKDPHDPHRNGLDYLSEWSLEEAAEMMTSPEWTRAVFIRDPKQRFLSAYLDKAARKEGQYVNRHCCNDDWTCAPKNISAFLRTTRHCYDPHWAPQTEAMSSKFWERIDFVGSFKNAHDDTKELLQKIGAWEEFGTGWGKDGDEEIFGETKTAHATGTSDRFLEHISESFERKVEERYAVDYRHELIAGALGQKE